jgi:hypothetical protein
MKIPDGPEIQAGQFVSSGRALFIQPGTESGRSPTLLIEPPIECVDPVCRASSRVFYVLQLTPHAS